ncbi:MAG: hypothetical protein N2Z74_03240 [Syntrophales bacterium]|nr:hypothetical protein [Syntrophales bacterium]
MYLEISLMFLSGAVLLIAVFTVPLLVQIQRLAKGLAETQAIIQKNLPTIMANLEETSTNIKRTTTVVNNQIEQVSLIVVRLQSFAALLAEIEALLGLAVRSPMIRFLKTAGAVSKGLRVFMSVYATGRRQLSR